jgi:hypothetical protein
MISEDNLVINGLWIGDELSAMELLTLKSFVSHGHSFHLWAYNELKTPIPKGVVLKDANSIVGRERIFRYKFKNQFGHGIGSLAGFSDLFRYKLLYELGGWWVDMDVTCLKPFNHPAPYHLRAHHDLNVVGNVMKCPPKSELMGKCYDDACKLVDADNRDWHLPIQILNGHIQDLGLSKFIVDGQSPPDQWHLVYPYVHSKVEIPKEYYFIHWLNEVWRTKNLSKGVAFNDSVYASLLNRYAIPYAQPSLKYRMLAQTAKIRELVSLWLVKRRR